MIKQIRPQSYIQKRKNNLLLLHVSVTFMYTYIYIITYIILLILNYR
jgi:hypothetical protein